MKAKEQSGIARRSAQLHALARGYVTDGLGKANFDAIPYIDDIVLRAPILGGTSAQPIVGREQLRTEWWTAFADAVGEVEVLDTYVSHDLSAVAVEFHLRLRDPACTLRIMDRFQVNAEGEITHQENFFDPRALTGSNGASQ